MADFCKQCAEGLGFPRSDFEDPKLKPGLYHTNLCEGCGHIQTNGKGGCISSDCIHAGHHVPMDRCVKYYTNKEDFDFGGLQLREIEYGEWSRTIPEAAIEINDINEIPGNIGDMIYVCSLGTYNLMQIISDAYLKGFEASVEYNISGRPKLEESLKLIPEQDQKEFRNGWADFTNSIT